MDAREVEAGRTEHKALAGAPMKNKEVDMPKVKSSAKWNGLSPQQRSTLEEWLFEEKLSYTKATERARAELGFKGSRSSLRRYYERRAGERMLERFAESEKLMASVNGAPVEVAGLRSAGMKVAAQVFFRLVTERPEELKAWLPLAKLLAQCERNDSWRAVKDEENGIRRAALEFARVRFQYDTMEEAMKALPELKALKAARARAEMTVYEKNQRRNDVWRTIFGEAIPGLLPENEEEEAHPEIIERNYQEARRRQNEEWAREQRERQREQAEREAKKAGKKPGEKKPGKEAGEIVKAGNEENEGAKQDGRGQEEGTSTEANEGNEGKPASESDTASGPEPREAFVDEARKLTAEEREKNYEELMRRARGRWR
jgi:hypothetical protein